MSLSSARSVPPSRPAGAPGGRGVAGRRRGRGKRFLVVGDVMDGVLVHTRATGPGDHDPAATIRHRPAGAAGNTATWLGWLGAEVDLVGRVGVDDVYRHARALEDAGVRPHIHHDAGTSTGVVVSVRNARARTSMSDGAASALVTAGDVPDELVARADIVHLTGEAMLGSGGVERLAALVSRARSGSARVSFDPSSAAVVRATGGSAFLEAIAGVDLLVPGAAEALALTGAADVVEATRILSHSVPLVVVTLGHEGVLVGRPGRSPQRVPATAATVVDTIGAGDAFAAGFIRAWATDPVRVGAAAREGARVAARALGFVGGRPPV